MASKSRSIGGVYASLSLRDGGFKSGLKSARKHLNEFGSTALKGAAAGAVGLAAAMAVVPAAMAAGLVKGTRSTLSMVDDLGDVANQTGVTVAAMMKLQRAYADGGREAAMTGKDIGKMQKSLVTAASGGEDPFAAIGLSAAELLKLNPADQFDQIGAAIMRISNPAERTAKVMEIFGKGGMGLTTVFEGLPGAARALGDMPALAQKFAGAMGEANDLIGHLPIRSNQFFVGFTSGIIGELLPHLRKIDDFDFTQLGQNLGSALSTSFETLTEGTMWEIFQLHGEKAFLSIQTSPALNDFAAGINALWDAATTENGLQNFKMEDFRKYQAAGVAANSDLIDEKKALIDEKKARIEELMKQAADRYQEKSSAAAALTENPPIANPITGLAAAAAEAMKPTRQESSTPDRMEVNSYQRRGLSLDGAPAAVKIEKQTALLAEMRNFLKKMADGYDDRVW